MAFDGLSDLGLTLRMVGGGPWRPRILPGLLLACSVATSRLGVLLSLLFRLLPRRPRGVGVAFGQFARGPLACRSC